MDIARSCLYGFEKAVVNDPDHGRLLRVRFEARHIVIHLLLEHFEGILEAPVEVGHEILHIHRVGRLVVLGYGLFDLGLGREERLYIASGEQLDRLRLGETGGIGYGDKKGVAAPAYGHHVEPPHHGEGHHLMTFSLTSVFFKSTIGMTNFIDRALRSRPR